MRVLHDAYKNTVLRLEVFVPVRVITSQGDKEFGNNVAVNLNNQNKVDDSFLKSNHPRVIQLSHSLAVVSERVAQVAVRSMVAGVRPARPVCGRSVLYQASHRGRSAARLSAER